jgi:hypothetical protein
MSPKPLGGWPRRRWMIVLLCLASVAVPMAVVTFLVSCKSVGR